MASLTELGIIPFTTARQGLYVTLDSLFDTPLACLEEVNVDLALHAIKNNWCERVYDTVPGFPDEQYKKLYKARDANTLFLAHPTLIVDFIKSWIRQANERIAASPFGEFVELFINIWPYKLPKSFAKEIGKRITKIIDEDTRVTLLNIDPQDLSALDVKRFFSAMIDRDFDRWLNSRCAIDIKHCPLPDVSLYLPKVFRGSLDDATKSRFKDTDVFLQMQRDLKSMIRLDFLDLELFCSPVTADMLESDERPLAGVTPAEPQ